METIFAKVEQRFPSADLIQATSLAADPFAQQLRSGMVQALRLGQQPDKSFADRHKQLDDHLATKIVGLSNDCTIERDGTVVTDTVRAAKCLAMELIVPNPPEVGNTHGET